MDELKLKVSVDDANLILEALGERPFKQVYALIAELQRQAQSQMRDPGADDAAVPDGVDRQHVNGGAESAVPTPATAVTNGR